jgi:ubiquinone/menaquinone biosynthesis C-methylase UbiE
MNALDLRFADESFDFVWSLSSIEHFGSHAAAADAMREMARVVRPGGIVAVATELLLLDEYDHDEYFTRPQIDQYVVNASDRLALIEPIDWTLPPVEYLIDSIALPEGVHRRRRHVVLNDGSVQWTSILIFLRKR